MSMWRLVRSPRSRSVLIALVCIAAGLLAGEAYNKYEHRTPSLASLVACFATSTDPTYGSRCLHDTIKSLITYYPSKTISDYTVATTSPFIIRDQCHAIGHLIGAATYDKYATIETALAHCSSACRYACVHGAIGAGTLALMGQSYDEEDIAHADPAQLLTIAGKYCSRSQPICHGIGHVAYIETQDAQKAAGICDAVAQGDTREACYEGVFMEFAGSFNNNLFPTTTTAMPLRTTSYSYCATLPERYRHACFIFSNAYQVPLFHRDDITAPAARLEKAASVCDGMSGRDRAYCFEGIGVSSNLFGYPDPTAASIQSLCDRFPSEDDRSACTLGVIPQFIYLQLNGITAYCGAIDEEPRRTICFDAAFEQHDHYAAASDPSKWCAGNEECASRYATYRENRVSIPDYRYGLFGK